MMGALKVCQKNSPIDKNILISRLGYELGIAEKKATEFLKILYDVGKLKISEDNIVSVVEDDGELQNQ